MGKEIDTKSAILIIIIVVLVGAAGYLTYLISNDENPLILLNSRASEDGIDDSSGRSDFLAQAGVTPTPTVSFTSTSPTPVGGLLFGSPTPSLSASPSPSTTLSTSPTPTINNTVTNTPTPSSLPESGVGGNVVYVTATPTPVKNLPVAGVGDYIPHFIGGGLVLVVAALLL